MRSWIRVGMAALALLVTTTAHAQFHGYAAASYGYHSNPLYNYERIPDQVHQGFLELQYTHVTGTGTLSAGYTGGLMIFNTFTDRNYLEHALRVGYGHAYGTVGAAERQPAVAPAAEDQEEGTEETAGEETEEEAAPIDPDSVRTFLDLQLRGSARHDKDAFREFDNTGLALATVVRFPLGAWYLRVMDDLGMRSYSSLAELSNVTEHATVQFGRIIGRSVTIGAALAGGAKYYTSDMIDTSAYQTSVTTTGKGNGNGNANGKAKGVSKKVLSNTTTTTAWQIAGGVFGGFTWEQGMVSVTGWYRYNPGKGTRYLAQYANTSMLDEDIYNDFFSYEGPEVKLVMRQELPLQLQATVSGGWARRQFSASALELDQTDTGKKRRDVISDIEIGISRFFPVSEGSGIDLALTTAAMRNQSNDAYNDHGLWQAGLSLGIGF